MTDPTTPPPANLLTQIEATLSADWQNAANFLSEAEAFFGTFLTRVAAGAEVLIADIEQAGQYVAGHLTVINTSIQAMSSLVTTVAPGNVTAQKVIDDLNTGAQDVAALSNALTSGSAASDPAIVTSAVTAIGAVKQLAQIANNAGSMLTGLANSSPTATQAVTASSTSSTSG